MPKRSKKQLKAIHAKKKNKVIRIKLVIPPKKKKMKQPFGKGFGYFGESYEKNHVVETW